MTSNIDALDRLVITKHDDVDLTLSDILADWIAMRQGPLPADFVLSSVRGILIAIGDAVVSAIEARGRELVMDRAELAHETVSQKVTVQKAQTERPGDIGKAVSEVTTLPWPCPPQGGNHVDIAPYIVVANLSPVQQNLSHMHDAVLTAALKAECENGCDVWPIVGRSAKAPTGEPYDEIIVDGKISDRDNVYGALIEAINAYKLGVSPGTLYWRQVPTVEVRDDPQSDGKVIRMYARLLISNVAVPKTVRAGAALVGEVP